MKHLVKAYIFFLSIGIFASNFPEKVAETTPENTGVVATYLNSSPTKPSTNSTYKEFAKAAKKSGIPHRKLTNLKGVRNGYYVISGVYGSELNAKKFVKKLRGKGFAADYIQVAETGRNYVYLKYFKKGAEAVMASRARFNNRYKEDIWIMAVQNDGDNSFDPHANTTVKKRVRKVGARSHTTRSTRSSYKEFEKAANKSGIAHRKLTNLKGAKDGYYVISGVYGSEHNAKKTVKKLRDKGFSSNYIKVAETGFNYVYLKHFNKGQKALTACASKFNGLYKGAVWILVADNAQKVGLDLSNSRTGIRAGYSQSSNSLKIIKNNDETFEEAAKKNNVTYRTFSDLDTVPNGYYIISGTYSQDRNSDKAIKKLKRKDFEPGSVKNPKNGLNYVYLEYFQDWRKAIEVCKTKFDGRFDDEVWVMKVENSGQPIASVEPYASDLIEETAQVEIAEPDLNEQSGTVDTFEIEETSEDDFEELAPTFALKESSNKSKLIKKADHYFNKMWYAEAAELYEQALLKGDKYYSSEIIQKVADAHYYNTNMEKAYEWYTVLYENYGKELSADNIFKYAHALKGTGKYGRSKRIMRLYNKKVKNGALSSSNFGDKPLPNEMVLDNILASKENFDIKNLAINSEYSDFSPMFYDSTQVVFSSAMDSSFFNTRRYKWNDQPYLDLYVAKINEESQDLRDAIKFSKKINTKYHEASVTFSADNTTMYFTRNNYGKKLKRDKNGVNHLKIYMSQKVGDEWTEAIELPFNSNEYSTGHPALSPDGKQLYFVSDMPGSIGGTDLFVVDVLDTNNFSEPRNLGPAINTDKREMFPFFNGKKLYFSSNGHVGLGGLDVFEASYTEDEGFGEAKNVGQPVNSNKDDFSFIVNEETQKGFFASNRKGGKGDDDIYSFERLVLEQVPENLNAIAGVVTELVTGDLMPEALVILLDENNIKLKEVVTGDDGSFVFEDLDSNTKYNIKIQKGEFFDNETEVATKDNELVNVDVSMKRLEEMIAVEDGIKKLKTEMIHFDFDKSYIRTDAAIELDKLVAVMNEYPEMVIKIESHTDSRGSRAYNEYLSDKRAKSTKAYLIEQGIAPERIESAIGYGEERLLNECNGKVRCTEQAHYLNRRSEFIIVKM